MNFVVSLVKQNLELPKAVWSALDRLLKRQALLSTGVRSVFSPI
jgi:hypothetical protein